MLTALPLKVYFLSEFHALAEEYAVVFNFQSVMHLFGNLAARFPFVPVVYALISAYGRGYAQIFGIDIRIDLMYSARSMYSARRRLLYLSPEATSSTSSSLFITSNSCPTLIFAYSSGILCALRALRT